jgi:hypothetical protein
MDPQPRARSSVTLEIVSRSYQSYFWIVGQRGDGQPLFRGHWETDYLCGACGATLCEGIRAGMMSHLWFECACGALNRVPGGREVSAEDPG